MFAGVGSPGGDPIVGIGAFPQNPGNDPSAMQVPIDQPWRAIHIVPGPEAVGVPESVGEVVVTLARAGLTAAELPRVAVGYATANALPVSAKAGVDYVNISGTIVFEVGEATNRVRIPVIADGLREGTEFFWFELLPPPESPVTRWFSTERVYIDDDDTGFAFDGDSAALEPVVEVSEAASSVALVVLRGGDGPETVTVDFTTVDGTATAGADYVAVAGTLTFAPGELSKTVTVPLLSDVLPEGAESFGLRLLNPSTNALLGTNITATVRIADNDVGVVLEQSTNRVREDAGQYTVTVLKRTDPPRATVVAYRVGGVTATAGQDFTASSGVLEFGLLEERRTLTIPILDDSLVEGPESFVVELTASTGVPLGAQRALRITILDDEATPAVDPTGSVDPSFHPDIGGYTLRLAVQPNGRVLVGGDFYAVDGVARRDISRLLADGSLDPGFRSTDGDLSRVTSHRTPWGSLSLDSQGRILIAGAFLGSGGQYRPGLLRLHPDGSLDRSFVPDYCCSTALAASLPEGGVVFAGQTNATWPPTPSLLAKLKDDGTFDLSFEAPKLAWQRSPGGALDAQARLFADPAGRVLVTHASIEGAEGTTWPLVRLLPNGAMDPSFKPPVGRVRLGPVAMREDGRLVVATETNICSLEGYPAGCGRLFRLRLDGSIDAEFNPRSDGPTISALAVRPDGRVLVAYRDDPDYDHVAVERLHPDGRLDSALGPVWYGEAIPWGSWGVTCLASMTDGSVLVGTSGVPSLNGVPTGNLSRIVDRPSSDILQVRIVSDGVMRISVACAPGELYALESSPNLADWRRVATRVAVKTVLVFEVPAASHAEFFRVRSEGAAMAR